MVRLLMVVIVVAAGMHGNGQQTGASAPQPRSGAVQLEPPFPSKAELLGRIAMYEAAARNAEATHAGNDSLVKIYTNLSALYEDAAMYPKSENIMQREISALRSGSQKELAEARGHLAVLHIAMGELRKAEKDELEALRIRESVGDLVGIALSWNDLADVYIKERNFKKALDYAQRAMPVLANGLQVDPVDRITVRQTLAYALCGLKECGQAIPLLKDALELEKTTFGADSLMVGVGYYLLGYTYWQNGDIEDAAKLMARGTARMKIDLGWGHVVYLNAMSEYARFLRQRGQMEAAASSEREVRQAQSIVDARSFAPRQGALAGAGPR